FILLTVVQGLSLREKADNFPSDLLHRIGIAFSTSVNIQSGLALLLAVALVSVPALVPGADAHFRSLRLATLFTVDAVAAVIAAQTEVLRGLMAVGEERPTYDADLPARLTRLLEDGLGAAAPLLDVGQFIVSKHALASVLQCERMAMAETKQGFEWTASSARG